MVKDEEAKPLIHVLLLCFPGQGHINPFLRLAKILASEGFLVTFSTTEEAGDSMRKARDGEDKAFTSSPISFGKGKLRFEFFSDSCELEPSFDRDPDALMERLKRAGPKAVADLIGRQAREGRPVAWIINNPFLPWVLDIAAGAGIPVGLLWVQSCAVFSTYHYYCNDPSVEYPTTAESGVVVRLPGMPELAATDVPSFLLKTNPYMCLTEVILETISNLSKASWVMVDSFEELERPIFESFEGKRTSSSLSLFPIGPLLNSAQGLDREGSSVRGDLLKAAEDCVEWLDARPPASVVYVSLGSVAIVSEEETKEMAWGIRNSGRPFLWVMKGDENGSSLPEGFLEETAGRGLVVPWSPQERVLRHPSVACFLTHCGWNSSMESLCSGVPVVGFPQWGDQVTNAKFLAEVYGVGVRLTREKKGSSWMVSREEVERCITAVAGGGAMAEEMKKNALKWKEAAAAAVEEGVGSSDRNLQAVLDAIKERAAASTQGMIKRLY